ncbi:prolyl hydroxylase family protein [Archangium primigenium]|uniref:prolyl hydroxylase family protein n=1 Tax=[Archangium] primigenium TaxID=2792470 RepID=UPI00195F21A6|nr:2OG-Fe(II) oxygenase [Archangium primigenium]MBM7116470.1 2OG-Fe(II) oxygenase [Archangium primigenium]
MIEKQPLAEGVFTLEGFLSADACAELISLAEARGFSAAAVRTASGPQALSHIRNNDRLELREPAWAARFWRQLEGLGLPEVEGHRARALSSWFRFYRYVPGQRFRMHKDGRLQEDGLESRLTFLLYLNDDCAGGETTFKTFAVAPRQGSALLFVHETWHEGSALTSGTKYVLRSDVLYGP